VGIVLANPWGLMALAAVPLLIAIHSLRQRSRRVVTSTLFLLEHVGPLPTGGIRLERLRQAVPFWMQLLASLALTWLLVEPRFIRADSRQTVAVVLDSSASMAAFRGPTIAALERVLERLGAVAGHTDWHLLETGPRRPPLHAGDDLAGLLGSLPKWQPTFGTHDFTAALAVAQALAPADRGAVILVTDRDIAVPPGVALLSVGTPIDNTGFVGADVSADASASDASSGGPSPRWRAIVANRGQLPSRRQITILSGPATGLPTAPTRPSLDIDLAPGETKTLAGAWPAGAERVLLELTPDRFTLDDGLALVRPVPRTVRVAIRTGTPGGELLGRMLAAATDVEIVADADSADLVVEPFGTEGTGAAVQVAAAAPDTNTEAESEEKAEDAAHEEADKALRPPRPMRLDPAPLSVEDHPLVRDLAWNGFLSGPAGPIEPADGDEPLVWKGARPLVLLRRRIAETGTVGEVLLINADLEASTAARTPALVVLLERFVGRVRGRIERPWAGTFQAEEEIPMPAPAATLVVEALADPDAEFGETPRQRSQPFRGRAPADAGFFTVTPRDAEASVSPQLHGATQQADPRESDFRTAGPADTVDEVRLELARRQSVADPFLPGWLALVAAALLVAWGWPDTRRGQSAAGGAR
jgi:Aerotolerance regulator N-terminal